MVKDALVWLTYMLTRKDKKQLLCTGEGLFEAIKDRFVNVTDIHKAVTDLRELKMHNETYAGLQGYDSAFSKLSQKTEALSPENLTLFFVDGLSIGLRAEVRHLEPTSFDNARQVAYNLVHVVEQRNRIAPTPKQAPQQQKQRNGATKRDYTTMNGDNTQKQNAPSNDNVKDKYRGKRGGKGGKWKNAQQNQASSNNASQKQPYKQQSQQPNQWKGKGNGSGKPWKNKSYDNGYKGESSKGKQKGNTNGNGGNKPGNGYQKGRSNGGPPRVNALVADAMSDNDNADQMDCDKFCTHCQDCSNHTTSQCRKLKSLNKYLTRLRSEN